MALDKKMYRNCIGAIISLNAELPEDDGDKKYRIVFDSEQYYQKIKDSYLLVCTECDKETPKTSVQILDIALSQTEQIILGYPTRKIWICPKCKKENDLKSSRIIKTTLQKPYYHRVVPEPPRQEFGLLSQLQFHKDMVEWVWLCLNSLEDGFTRFRDDNWNKKSEYDELFDLDTTAEESA